MVVGGFMTFLFTNVESELERRSYLSTQDGGLQSFLLGQRAQDQEERDENQKDDDDFKQLQ